LAALAAERLPRYSGTVRLEGFRRDRTKTLFHPYAMEPGSGSLICVANEIRLGGTCSAGRIVFFGTEAVRFRFSARPRHWGA
jgi:hypothetical protein